MKSPLPTDSGPILNALELPDLERRGVLKAGAGLTLAVMAGPVLTACAPKGSTAAAAGPLAPTAFVRIGTDNVVTVISRNTELGQGTYTGLATLVAEELDADWSQIVVEGAPADASRYANPAFGPMQGTGGSTSIAGSYLQLRQTGATARAMLVAAAAQQWGVAVGDITVAKGVVSQVGKGKSATFGELAGLAATLPVPKDVALKDPKHFTLIGQPRDRVDARAKSSGTAMYTQDVKLPDMLVAVILAAPRWGATVKGFDATAAKALPGVSDVVQFKTPLREGVAVLARDYWAAKKGRDAVKVEWDESAAYKLGSAEILAQYKAEAMKPGDVARKDGDAEKALAGAVRHVEAAYDFPFLSHASMEPLNCVVHITAGGCEIWNGEQFQTGDQMVVAKYLGLKPEQVKINMLFAGGSFGRRGNGFGDYLLDAAAIAQAGGNGKPVKMVWSREDDMRGGFYRPAYYHTLKAGLDAKGRIVSWQHRIVGQSILAGTPLAGPGPIDASSVEGAATLPYDIANIQVELHTTKLAVPIQWWRSVGSTHTAYATECFLDDVARATHQDPVELRRGLLKDKHPRHLAVLNLAAEKAGWGSPLPAGSARGVAVHECFNTVVAQVVEVSKKGKGFKVDRVVCAVDCGRAINPNIVAMQMESGIGYGLGAAISGAITLKGGAVEQGNFDGYQVLRMNQMPAIEVHILPSEANPTGVGEPATPVIGPAVANAIAALTGKAARNLPFSREGLSFA